jgi:hypothetical protein
MRMSHEGERATDVRTQDQTDRAPSHWLNPLVGACVAYHSRSAVRQASHSQMLTRPFGKYRENVLGKRAARASEYRPGASTHSGPLDRDKLHLGAVNLAGPRRLAPLCGAPRTKCKGDAKQTRDHRRVLHVPQR